MAQRQALPSITLDDLNGRAREIVANLHGVQLITENGQPAAALISYPAPGTLGDLEAALETLQSQVEVIKESIRRGASLNLAVEEFHYPTE